MSDPRLSTIGALLGGAPEHLVERSAEARAEAQGVPVEQILAAWSGGEEMAVAPPVAAVTPDPPAAVPEPEASPGPAPALAPPEPAFEVPLAAVELVEEEEVEPVEPAPLSDRIRLGARVGAGIGAALGLLSLVAMAPLVLGRLSETTAAGGPAVEVTWTAVVATAALWAVIGAIVTLASRGAGRFRSPAYDTATTTLGSVLSGGFLGMVLGFGQGGLIYALAEPSLSGTKLIAVSPLMLLGVVLADALLGAAVGGASQALAQPAALVGDEAEQADTVKRRLSDAILLPVASLVIILVIVVAFGSLLLRYSSYAPLIAILVSAGALGFAAAMASRPNLRVTRNEVLVAAAGIGVVLLMIALVAASTSTGHSEEDAPADHALVSSAPIN